MAAKDVATEGGVAIAEPLLGAQVAIGNQHGGDLQPDHVTR